jgi:hypothetical protein
MYGITERKSRGSVGFIGIYNSPVFKIAIKGLLWRNRLARSLEDVTKRISRWVVGQTS